MYGKTAYSVVFGSTLSKNTRTNSSSDVVAPCVNNRFLSSALIKFLG